MTTKPIAWPLAGQPPQVLANFWREAWPLIALAIPLVASLTTSTMMGLVDTYMLGSKGEAVLGAVSLTSSVLLIFYASMYGFMSPIGILAGQAFGAGQANQVAGLIRHGLVIAFLGGLTSALTMTASFYWILPYAGQPAEVMAVLKPYWVAMSFSLLPYSMALVYKQVYDSIDRPWIGFGLTFVAVFANIALNGLLINGHWGLPALGILGAGMGSLLAQTLGFIGMALHYRYSAITAPYRTSTRWSVAQLTQQLREGMPMAIQYLGEGSAIAVAGVLIGLLGATALAANQIVYSVVSVLYMLPLGMAGAVSIRVAQAEGGGEPQRLRQISFTALGLVTGWAVLFTAGLLLAGRAIADLFVDEPQVIAAAAATFVAVGVMQVFDGLQSVSLGALRGILDTRWPTRISLIGYWVIALPLGFFLGYLLELGPAGFWSGVAVGLAFAAVMLVRRVHQKMAA